MSTQYTKLEICQFSGPLTLSPLERPLPPVVYLTDGAESVMIDIETAQVMRVHAEDKIDQIKNFVEESRVHAVLVIDHQNLIGILRTRDIKGLKLLKIVQLGVLPREEITARMVMTPIEQVLIINHTQLTGARVGNLVATFKYHKKPYILIIEEHKILGLISVDYLAEQLGQPILSLEDIRL